MDTTKAFAWLLIFMMVQNMSCSLASEFQVGGKDGWVLNPHESYTQWSGRNRFQVHDKLVFKYKMGEDSVLLVSKEAYDKCNVSNPIKKFDDGNSVFEFDRTGPFYFISGAPGKCSQGQKLNVVVISLKTKKPNISPAPSPTSSVSPQAPSVSPSPSPSPSSEASSPSASPGPSPIPSISISPSPTMGSPVSSPTSSVSAQSPSPTASSGVPSSLPPGQSSEPTNAASSPGSSPTGPNSHAPALAATWMSFGLVTSVFCGLFLS